MIISKKFIYLNDGQRIDLDEHRFCAVLKRGPVMSKKGSPLQVIVVDLLDETQWPMTFLEASQLSSEYSTFNTIGVLAWWKVTLHENQIWLHLETMLPFQSKTQVRDALLDTTNAEWCRKRYLAFFNKHPTIFPSTFVTNMES